jgi:hypothetical protein
MAVRPLIAGIPAKPAEPAEVLADVGYVQVLVPHIGSRIPNTHLPQFISGSSNPENVPVACIQENDCF